MSYPLLMTEDYWMNSMLSIVRDFGTINISGHTYIIVDKHGRDIFECSRIAEKEGRDKAIEDMNCLNGNVSPSRSSLFRQRKWRI